MAKNSFVTEVTFNNHQASHEVLTVKNDNDQHFNISTFQNLSRLGLNFSISKFLNVNS